MMGRDAIGALRCTHIGMFLARSCAPLGAYRAREARCRRNGADGAGDVPLSVALVPLSVALGRCRSLALRGLIISPQLKSGLSPVLGRAKAAARRGRRVRGVKSLEEETEH